MLNSLWSNNTDKSVEVVVNDVHEDSDSTVEGGIFVETENIDNFKWNLKNKENQLRRIKSEIN